MIVIIDVSYYISEMSMYELNVFSKELWVLVIAHRPVGVCVHILLQLVNPGSQQINRTSCEGTTIT